MHAKHNRLRQQAIRTGSLREHEGQVLPRAPTRYQRDQKIYHSADGEQKYRFPVAQIHPWFSCEISL